MTAITNNYHFTQFRRAGLTVKYASKGSGSCGGILDTSFLIASNNDYSKKDAIMKQWNLKGSFNIYEEVSVDKLQDPNPSDEVLKEFEKELQTNGIQKEMNWSALSFDFMGIGFDEKKSVDSIKENDFTKKVEYLASRYASVEYKIKNTTSGEAQAEQLKKLQEVYQKTADEIANGYSTMISSYMEGKGITGEKEKIYHSVISGIETKIAQYRQSLSDNATLKELEGTADKWLLDDDAFVASVLRKSENSAVSQKDSQYTLKDLETLGQYVSSLSNMEKPSNMTSNVFQMDEGRIGLEFSMLAMKTDALQNKGILSNAMSKTLQKVMNNFMNSFLDSMDKSLSDKRKENAVQGDEIGFAALNKNMVWDIYNHTMQKYQQSGDMLQALIKGAEYGATKVMSQSANGAYRYKNNTSYWKNFFENDAKNTHLNSYQNADTTFQKYFAGVVDFENSLNSGKSVHMNIELKSVDYYNYTKSNLITKNA